MPADANLDPNPVPLLDLKRFDIDPERGFLPGEDPLQVLPRAYAAWDEAGAQLARLLVSGRLRRTLEELPTLPTHELEEPRALRRAMLLLSYLGHAYVWGETRPAARIPAPLAVPWAAVASRLGRPPVLSYASYALDNWRRFDPSAGVTLDNAALLQNFLGGVDEDWFIGVHIEIEFRAAALLRQVGPLLAAARREDFGELARGLRVVATTLEVLVGILQRMPESCDPYIYYHRVRPYIHGWRDHPTLPEGVVYQGVPAFGERGQRFRGETGAQSGIVPTVDALLGIAHAEDPLREYLLEMRDYMPPAHRRFVATVERESGVRSALLACDAAAAVEARQAYDECLHWLEAFRSTHLEYAASYIFAQSQSDAANPTTVGTGGTPFMPYLAKHRDETARHRLAG